MPIFRKKPVTIEARQLSPFTRAEIKQWVGENAWFYDSNGESELYIQTLEGVMTAGEGDWIIKGVKNEFYPCKPDIFDATYEFVQ